MSGKPKTCFNSDIGGEWLFVFGSLLLLMISPLFMVLFLLWGLVAV
jgi:hypothetical protein